MTRKIGNEIVYASEGLKKLILFTYEKVNCLLTSEVANEGLLKASFVGHHCYETMLQAMDHAHHPIPRVDGCHFETKKIHVITLESCY